MPALLEGWKRASRRLLKAEPETLAHHFAEAGSAEKAVQYRLKAGQLALRRSANAEAIAHLRKGIELISSLSDSAERLKLEIQLQSALGVALMGAKGFASSDVLQAMSRARLLSERIGDDHQLFKALCGEASCLMIAGRLREADALGQRCMALATSTRDEGLLLEAHHRLWATKFYMGDYSSAKQHLDYGLATCPTATITSPSHTLDTTRASLRGARSPLQDARARGFLASID